MGTITYQIPQAGQPNATEDAKVATALTTLLAFCNGGIDGTNLSALLAQAAGVNQAGQTVKGAVNIATSQSTSSTSYTTLATPDQVTGIVLPANGLIRVWYQATWQESVSGAAAANIFLNSNALVGGGSGTLLALTASIGGTAARNVPLTTSSSYGLISCTGNTGYVGDATTGQIVGNVNAGASGIGAGGATDIFATAGTYTVSVQFKVSLGTQSVTASNRKLWVQALSFV